MYLRHIINNNDIVLFSLNNIFFFTIIWILFTIINIIITNEGKLL